MSTTLAAILSAAGAVAFLVITATLTWWFLFRKKLSTPTSETGSSDPSAQALERHTSVELSLREAKCFDLDELSLATKSFSDKNLIGCGKFGEVFKGLLNDGMLVAIKRRRQPPSQEFVDEVRYLASIYHRNLVSLLGYCQEDNQQFLVYEYIPSGSVSSYLYGEGQISDGKLEFKLRLSIALGAAKGLAHLHSLTPRLIHKDFKTSNVLVDENFIAKVADSGLRNFLYKSEVAGSSSLFTAGAIFQSPEVKEFNQYSERSDVFSFGVFLLELLAGKEASQPPFTDNSDTLLEWVQKMDDYVNFASIVDKKMGSSFTSQGMEEFIEVMLRCIEASSQRRPLISHVAADLDRILEKEMTLTTVMTEEGTPTVTLGSQLFRAVK